MDIYELRRDIAVTIYYCFAAGATILYTNKSHTNSIKLTWAELIKELQAIGSLDDNYASEDLINYHLSQWDALSIAIRFELARAMDKELDNSDIGKAIKNITNGQTDAY